MANKDESSPGKFVKPADLFKMRRRTSNNFAAFNTNSNSLTPVDNKSREAPSPLASNSRFASPTKQPSTSSVSIQASPLKSNVNLNHRTPTKIFNLPPVFHIEPQSPLKCLNNISDPSPTKNLPVLLKNPFNQPVKRKLNLGTSPRKQKSPNKRTRMLELDEDANLEPPEMKQVKNIKVKVFQHPYLSWLPLFPRLMATGGRDKKAFGFVDHALAGEMMHKDWCDSLGDLAKLFIEGKCPQFYLCTDNYNILFKSTPTSNTKKPLLQALISPFSYGMGCKFNNLSIEFKCPELKNSDSSSNLTGMMTKDNSQTSFGSSRSQTTNFEDDNISQSASRQANSSKVTASIDSGNVSDLDEDDSGEDENDDGSQFLESIGLSVHDFPTLQLSKKGYIVESDSNTQTKTTSNKHLAAIDGLDNIQKLVKFLQTNRLYTINNVGKFAFIPPTLLSPCEYKLGTQRLIASKELDLFPIKSTWSL